MKYLVVSDIHGSIDATKTIIEKFNQYNCDKILCLGDILYHGPRNNLPDYYQPKEVIDILNQYKDKIISAKGNCDAEVDEMVLEFKLEPLVTLNNDNYNVYLTHGHLINQSNPLKTAKPNDIVFYGHTHVSKFDKIDGVHYINPGSTTIPREKTVKSYIIFDENKISLYDFNDKLINEIIL